MTNSEQVTCLKVPVPLMKKLWELSTMSMVEWVPIKVSLSSNSQNSLLKLKHKLMQLVEEVAEETPEEMTEEVVTLPVHQ